MSCLYFQKIFSKTAGFKLPFKKDESAHEFILTGEAYSKLFKIKAYQHRRAGSALIVCFLLMAMFVTLGLGFLLEARMFFEIQASKKMHRLNGYACENGAKKVAGMVISRADEFPGGQISEELFQNLKASLLSGGEEKLVLMDSFLRDIFLAETDDFSGLIWEASPSASLKELCDYESYLKSTYELIINATGQVEGFRWKKDEQVVLEISFFLGKLPLDRLPLSATKSGLIQEDEQKIKITRLLPTSLKQEKAIRTAESLIPDDALPVLSKGLKLFRPDGLPNWLLRQALGLSPGNGKVPDGVYLARDDLGPGGIYVQGNLDELLLGLDGDLQLVQFRQENRRWLLRFSPHNYGMEFWKTDGKEVFAQSPVPVVMVNGRIEALASGQNDGTGWLKPDDSSSGACLRNGLKLTLVCSGKINITSNLISEGVDWREGLPYLRGKQSQLIIWSTARDFQTQENTDGGINIDGAKGSVLKVAASLLAKGEGLSIGNQTIRAEIVGTISASSINPGRANINLIIPPASHEENNEFSVYATENLLFLDEIKIREWRTAK